MISIMEFAYTYYQFDTNISHVDLPLSGPVNANTIAKIRIYLKRNQP